jgi:hypothetical protein
VAAIPGLGFGVWPGRGLLRNGASSDKICVCNP